MFEICNWFSTSCHLLHSQSKQSEIPVPLKVLGVRHLNIFADPIVLALALGSRTLTVYWMVTL